MKTYANDTISPVTVASVSKSSITDPRRPGLTKREYFAGLAMQGLMANPERYKYVVDRMDRSLDKPWSQEDATRHNAEKAVRIADALIDALNEEKPA